MKTFLAAALLLGAVSTADAQCVSIGGRGFGFSACAPGAYAAGYYGGGYGYRPWFGGRDWRVPGPLPGVLRDPTGALRGYPPMPSPPIYAQRQLPPPVYGGPPVAPPSPVIPAPPIEPVPGPIPPPSEQLSGEPTPSEIELARMLQAFCARDPNARICRR
jgi:hypothetical protein